MKELIDVFRMSELPNKTRARIIIKLGNAINRKHGMSMTESLVYELVKILDPENKILSNESYLKFANREE